MSATTQAVLHTHIPRRHIHGTTITQKRIKIDKDDPMTERPPLVPAAPAAASAARPSNPSCSQAKVTMPYPCPPDYQLPTQPTVTEEVRSIPVAKCEGPGRTFPLGPAGSHQRVLKRPQTPPKPRTSQPAPLDERSYPSTLNVSPSEKAGQPKPTRPVPISKPTEQAPKSGSSTPRSMSTAAAEALPPPLPPAGDSSGSTASAFQPRPVPPHLQSHKVAPTGPSVPALSVSRSSQIQNPMQRPVVNGMNDWCAEGCRPAKGLYPDNVLDRAISHTEIFQDRPPCGLNPDLPFGCILKQDPITIGEATTF